MDNVTHKLCLVQQQDTEIDRIRIFVSVSLAMFRVYQNIKDSLCLFCDVP